MMDAGLLVTVCHDSAGQAVVAAMGGYVRHLISQTSWLLLDRVVELKLLSRDGSHIDR